MKIVLMRLRITIAMLEIRNRETLQSKVNICKSDVKIGDCADSLISSTEFYVQLTVYSKWRITQCCAEDRYVHNVHNVHNDTVCLGCQYTDLYSHQIC